MSDKKSYVGMSELDRARYLKTLWTRDLDKLIDDDAIQADFIKLAENLLDEARDLIGFDSFLHNVKNAIEIERGNREQIAKDVWFIRCLLGLLNDQIEEYILEDEEAYVEEEGGDDE